MNEALQFGGAAGILVAFGFSQFGRLAADSYPYLGLNLVGSGLLAVAAYDGGQAGFLVLEGAWVLFSLYGLLRKVRSPRARA